MKSLTILLLIGLFAETTDAQTKIINPLVGKFVTGDPSGPIDFEDPVTRTYYNQSRTQALVDLFLELATGVGVTIIADTRAELLGVVNDNTPMHSNHIHVWIADPDGNN